MAEGHVRNDSDDPGRGKKLEEALLYAHLGDFGVTFSRLFSGLTATLDENVSRKRS
jgi:hypothetical protein